MDTKGDQRWQGQRERDGATTETAHDQRDNSPAICKKTLSTRVGSYFSNISCHMLIITILDQLVTCRLSRAQPGIIRLRLDNGHLAEHPRRPPCLVALAATKIVMQKWPRWYQSHWPRKRSAAVKPSRFLPRRRRKGGYSLPQTFKWRDPPNVFLV